MPVDIFRLDHEVVDYANPLITLLGLPRSPEADLPVLEPAQLETRELLLASPGYTAHFMRCSTTSSTTAAVSGTVTTTHPAGFRHPCEALDIGAVGFHIASPSREVASTFVNGRGAVSDVLFTLSRCLRNHGCLPPATVFSSPDDVVVGRSRAHVFIHSVIDHAADSRATRCWVWHPDWSRDPALLSCAGGLTRAAILSKLGIEDAANVCIAMQGMTDPGRLCPEHGGIVLVFRAGTPFLQVPLLNLWPRFQDILSLLFKVQGPRYAALADDHKLQHH